MNDAALESFRQIASAMGIETPAQTVNAWIWEHNGKKVCTTKERAIRYAASAGGTAYPEQTA